MKTQQEIWSFPGGILILNVDEMFIDGALFADQTAWHEAALLGGTEIAK